MLLKLVIIQIKGQLTLILTYVVMALSNLQVLSGDRPSLKDY